MSFIQNSIQVHIEHVLLYQGTIINLCGVLFHVARESQQLKPVLSIIDCVFTFLTCLDSMMPQVEAVCFKGSPNHPIKCAKYNLSSN